MTDFDGGSSAADTLLSTPAPDDAGAETADRYEWQAMMATAHVLSIYLHSLDENGHLIDGAEFTIVCEHHEDWAIIKGIDAEIVSAKHREASVNPFSTVRQLFGDGGILHLFNRWSALGQTPSCRLVTTGGLSGDAAKLARVCKRLRADRQSQDEDVVEVVTVAVQVIVSLKTTKDNIPAPESTSTVRAFLAGLTIQHSEARRDHLRDMAAQRFGLPIAERLGNADAAGAVWKALLGVVRQHMQAAGRATGGSLPTVLGVVHDTALATRTLTLADVEVVVRFAVEHLRGYSPLPRRIIANRMGVKMAEGGCSDNAIQRADELRLQYRRYWRAHRNKPNISDLELQVNNTLHRVIDEATHVVRMEGRTWGAELWREMDRRFSELEGQASARGLSADLLLGGASELANKCRAWYSDAFDVDQVLQRILTGAAAS